MAVNGQRALIHCFRYRCQGSRGQEEADSCGCQELLRLRVTPPCMRLMEARCGPWAPTKLSGQWELSLPTGVTGLEHSRCKWMTGPFQDGPWVSSHPASTQAHETWSETDSDHRKGPGHLLTTLLITGGFDLNDSFLLLSFIAVTRCYIRILSANSSQKRFFPFVLMFCCSQGAP